MNFSLLFFFIAMAGILMPPAVRAGQYSVSPIMLTLAKGSRSGSITIVNEGQTTLQLEISASEWSQDGLGKDVYTPTSDIVYYPKMMALAAGEQRLIRIGVKGKAPVSEKTYRMFIRENQRGEKSSGSGEKAPGWSTQLSFNMVFAPPIFRAPAVPRYSGSIDTVGISKGAVQTAVSNTGTVHFRLFSVTVIGKAPDGQEVFKKEASGWYLLSGASRTYEVPLSRNECRELAALEVTATAEEITLNRTVDVRSDMCLP